MTKSDEFQATCRSRTGQARYLTTAIPYVNAAPHIGFALEMVQADCLARLYRAQGHQVRFQAGTDDNSLKNVQAAQAQGLPVEELVRSNATRFRALKEALDLSFDDFISTSSDDRHRPGVERLWAECDARGDIYKRAYEGLYCTGCEQFYTPKELADGLCPEHLTAPEQICEENYFFRLSRYGGRLREAISSGELTITPDSRRNEVLALIERGLEDFSISRSASRAHGWGIPVPGDPGQVIYVWFDALANYITALGYGTDGSDLTTFWRQAAAREHVIGKGITRFHAVYWPAILLSAGLPLPTRLYVHGYITVEGRKIGKSAGNAIDPVPLAGHLGADALRYYLLRHIRSTEDGDFVRQRYLGAYDTDLAGQLGNLAHRTQSMIQRYRSGIVPEPEVHNPASQELLDAAGRLPGIVEAEIESFQFSAALAAIWDVVAQANKFVASSEPWALARTAAQSPGSKTSADAAKALDSCLYSLAHVLTVIGRSLGPLLPSTSEVLLRQLGGGQRGANVDGVGGARLNAGALLFPKRS